MSCTSTCVSMSHNKFGWIPSCSLIDNIRDESTDRRRQFLKHGDIKKFFQGHYQSVKQFGYRSGPMFWVKLFAKDTKS